MLQSRCLLLVGRRKVPVAASTASTETDVARIEREDYAVPETVGLTLDESKALTAAFQTEIVSAQVAVMGERFRWCEQCGAKLVSKGYYATTFRSLFGDVPLRIRRLNACPCRAEMLGAKSFAAWVPMDGIAPELAYITAKYAALAVTLLVGRV